MNRRALIALGVAAALAAAAYVLFFRGSSDAAPAPGQVAADQATPAPTRDVPAQPRRPVRVGGPAPRAVPADPGDGTAISYQEDGTEVRDHRTNKEPYLRPGLPHPSMSPVTPVVVSRVMALVRPVVLGCFASIPDEALGDKGTVMTRAVVSIDGAGKLSVEELGPAAGGLDAADPDALATALECVRSGAAGLTTQVDHAAVDHATLAFPIQPAKYRRHK